MEVGRFHPKLIQRLWKWFLVKNLLHIFLNQLKIANYSPFFLYFYISVFKNLVLLKIVLKNGGFNLFMIFAIPDSILASAQHVSDS